MIDAYFRRPIFWDYLFGISIAILIAFLSYRGSIAIPDETHLYSIISDLATISLTLAGFVLTLLTVLVSFKSSVKPVTDVGASKRTAFDYFFSTDLYFVTVRHLKNAIISLTLVAIFGYILKLSLKSLGTIWVFFYDIFGITVIFFTLWRCVVILTKIVKLQEGK